MPLESIVDSAAAVVFGLCLGTVGVMVSDWVRARRADRG